MSHFHLSTFAELNLVAKHPLANFVLLYRGNINACRIFIALLPKIIIVEKISWTAQSTQIIPSGILQGAGFITIWLAILLLLNLKNAEW